MTDVFIQPLYMFFLPFFALGMLVSLPLALTRGRIVLKIVVCLGLVGVLGLVIIGLTVPYAAIGYYFTMYWAGPALMAGAVALLLTSERMKTHSRQHVLISILIVGGPLVLGQVFKTTSNTIAQQKADEQIKNEPVLRKTNIGAEFGQHQLYIPLGSRRISVWPERSSTLSMRDYEDAKALTKMAKRAKTPIPLRTVYFSGYKPKTCQRDHFKNPVFWCDFEPIDRLFAFKVSRNGVSPPAAYRGAAAAEPDARGLIESSKNSGVSRSFLLPISRTKDAVGNPLRLVCKPPYSKGTGMECSLTFAVSKTISVNVMQIRADEMEMADIAHTIQKDAQKILAQLQIQP